MGRHRSENEGVRLKNVRDIQSIWVLRPFRVDRPIAKAPPSTLGGGHPQPAPAKVSAVFVMKSPTPMSTR